MTDRIVLDASAVLPWCFEDEATADTTALLDRLKSAVAAVPPLWHAEVANALVQGQRRRRIAARDIDRFEALLDALDIETDRDADTRGLRALVALAQRYDLTAYDAAYLELAIRSGAALATRDAALARAAKKAGVEVASA